MMTYFWPESCSILAQHKPVLFNDTWRAPFLLEERAFKKLGYSFVHFVERAKLHGANYDYMKKHYGDGYCNIAIYVNCLWDEEMDELKRICAIEDEFDYIDAYNAWRDKIFQEVRWYHEPSFANKTRLEALAFYDDRDRLLMFTKANPYMTIDMHAPLQKFLQFTSKDYQKKMERQKKAHTFYEHRRLDQDLALKMKFERP